MRENAAVLVGIDTGLHRNRSVEESLAELQRLADTLDIETAGILTQKMSKPHPTTYLGSGKIDELRQLAKSLGASHIVFDDELSPRQLSTLEKELPDAVISDRTALILDIFALHARTREGKLQVELATLEYELPRLRGKWAHLTKEKLGGGIGARFGEGESQLETDRRLARKRISQLKRELVGIEAERATQRASRLAAGVFKVALVGYTNAGKSTLLNALTGADVLAYDKLFATLDSTTRRYELPSKRLITITDTVGFINKLPPGLIAAFRSTLAEVLDADLLLHVVDAHDEEREYLISTVHGILHDIGAGEIESIIVWNKIDLLKDPSEIKTLQSRYPYSVALSAEKDTDFEQLNRAIERAALKHSVLMNVLLPFSRGDLVTIAHEHATVLSEEYTGEGTQLSVRVPFALAGKFEPYMLDTSTEKADDLTNDTDVLS